MADKVIELRIMKDGTGYFGPSSPENAGPKKSMSDFNDQDWMTLIKLIELSKQLLEEGKISNESDEIEVKPVLASPPIPKDFGGEV